MAIEKREQVFVSSTFLDLQDERQAIIQTLLQADCFPAGMEFFPASNDEKWDLIKRVIDDSDYYVVVIGGRYGSQADDGLSYTEKEFDYAAERGKPIMAFLHGDPGAISVDMSDIDPAIRAKLDDFRAKAGKRMAKFWRTPSELAANLALSLIQSRKTHPVEGWIRADKAASSEVLGSLATAQIRIVELEEELAKAKVAPPVGIDTLSRGTNKFAIDVWVKAKVSNKDGQPRPDITDWIPIVTTWDDVFAAIGPHLLLDAEEEFISQTLTEWIEFSFIGEIYDSLNEDLEKLESKIPKENRSTVGSFDVELELSRLGSILLQFKALGLITRSERKRSVHDHGSYWALTPFGEQSAIRVRAIKHEDALPPDKLKQSAGTLPGVKAVL